MGAAQLLLLLSTAAAFHAAHGLPHDEILASEKAAMKADCPASAVKRLGGLGRGAALTHAGLVLLAQGKADKAAACVIKAIEASGDAQAWAVLGEILASRGKEKEAEALFKRAASVSRGSIPGISVYELLGPFSIGKGEVDGDPLEAPALGGVDALPIGKGSFNSEYAGEGVVTWQAVPAQGGAIDVSFPKIRWKELIDTTSSMPILEWQAWAVAHAVLYEEGDYRVACQGVHTFSLGHVGQPWLSGDIYRSGMLWAPVHLSPGVHTLYVRVRAKVQTQIKCEVEPVSDSLVVFPQQFIPDVVDGSFVGAGLVPLPVHNMHPTAWIRGVRASLEKPGKPAVRVVEGEGVDIAPGQQLAIHVGLEVEGGAGGKCPTPFKVKVSGTLDGAKVSQTVTVRVRCREKSNQSFLMAFIDHDGSASQAAIVPPLEGCRLDSDAQASQACPVLLSMHGTGVPANDQADAYKVQRKDGSWEFGVRGAWTLAPGRFGAHNWEGTGMRSGLAALEALAGWTAGGWGGNAQADAARVLFAGHSMGGHGAWVISTHFPDLALGVASAAGWIRKEYYGDSNDLFLHDLSVAHADAQLKAVFEAAVVENYVDLLAANLGSVPVLARVGSEDRSVPPWQQRRMARVLGEHGVSVTFEEIQGQAHWWWDSKSPSDGGCVNDASMRSFFAQQLQPSQANATYKQKKKGSESSKAPESGVQKEDAAVSSPTEFELVVVNPSSFGSKGSLKVLQQHFSHRQSRIAVRAGDGGLRVLTTRNVRRFAFVEVLGAKEGRALLSDGGVSVDGTFFSRDAVASLYEGYSRSGLHLCRHRSSTWAICEGDFYLSERSPLNYGPARQVFEAPFLFVTPSASEPCVVSGGSDDVCGGGVSSARLLQSSVYLTNMHRAAASTHARIVLDKDLTAQTAERHNLVLMGSPKQNAWAKHMEARLPVRFGPQKANATAGHGDIPEGYFAIGGCVYGGPGVGVVYTFPMPLSGGPTPLAGGWNMSAEQNVQKGGAIGLGIFGTDEQGLRDIVSLGAPTIPPMVRAPFTNQVPDYIVTSPDFRWKGIGGILAAGYWGSDWRYSPHSGFSTDTCSFE